MTALLHACGGDAEPPTAATCLVKGVAVSPASRTLVVGANDTFTATVTSQGCQTNPQVTWSSNANGIATVNAATGVVTAIAPGSAIITATSGGVKGTATTTVTAPQLVVTLGKERIVLQPGPGSGPTSEQLAATVQLGATVVTGRAISYLSSDPGVATVNAAGLVTAISEGITLVTASSDGVTSAPVTVSVTRAFGMARVIYVAPEQRLVVVNQVNTSGGDVSAERIAEGLYKVTFNGLGVSDGTIGRNFAVSVHSKQPGKNEQIVSGPPYCHGSDLSVAGPVQFTVRCVDPGSGALLEGSFVVTILGDNSTTGGPAAFSHHIASATGTYSPPSSNSWNSSGAPMTVTVGADSPLFGGLVVRHSHGAEFPGVHAVVTSFSTTPTTCTTRNTTVGSTDVICFDKNGPVSATHSVKRISGGRPGHAIGLGFVDAATGQSQTIVNSAGGSISATRTGKGFYTVVFNGLNTSGFVGFAVSIHGATGMAYCTHNSVLDRPLTVHVACFDKSATLADPGIGFYLLALQ